MANRIKAASMTVFADDTQLDRLQAFGSSSRLDPEDLKEIGNLDIVEVIDNVPTVDITCDSNQYGSNKTLRKFANKNFDWSTIGVTLATDTSGVSVSSGYYYIGEMKYTFATTSGITILPAPTGAAEKRIDVISINTAGAITKTAGTATTGTPTVPATPTGELKLAEVQANYGEVLTALNIVNCYDDTTVLLKDFEFANVDLVCPVKETGDNTTDDQITRTMYVEDAFVNRYDAAFSVNGLATESYSLESDNKKWFLGTKATMFVDRYQGDGSTSAFTLSYTPTQMKNDNYATKVYTYTSAGVYDKTLAEGTDFTIAATTLTMTAAPAADTVVIARYPTTSAAAADIPFFKRQPSEIAGHPGIPGGLKHGQIEIYLSDDSANHVLRLQSVSISTALSREPLYEIGHLRAYDRPMTFPIPITITVEALSSDLQEFARLCGQTFASASELDISDFIKNLDLTVKVYREDDIVRATAPYVQSIPLKTITVTDVSITSEGFDLRVDGNATQTFELKANTNLSIVSKV